MAAAEAALASTRTLERAPAEPAQGIVPGMVLHSLDSGTEYLVRKRLGAGSFGAVWLCREVATGEKRAVKVLGAERRADLVREVLQMRRALDLAGNYCVPELHEACEAAVEERPDERLLVIAMEFIDGITLSALARYHAGHIKEIVGRSVLGDLCVALDRLHKAGIVHRDVKGDNVLVSRTGRAYLCDFNLSALVHELHEEQRLAGTVDFMAPELLGRVPRYSIKSDVWAFGICAIELATGTTPARAQGFTDPAQIIEWIGNSPPPEVPVIEGWPYVFRDATERCLVRDPAERITCGKLLERRNFFQPFTERWYRCVQGELEKHHAAQFDNDDD